MSDTRRDLLKKGIATATVTGLGVTGATGSASAASYDTVVEVTPESTSDGPQHYEIEFTNASAASGEGGTFEACDDFDFEDNEIVFFGTVEDGVDDLDKASTDAAESDVKVNRADNVVVYVNGSAIYP